MIFISDIHHGLNGLNELPEKEGPIVILGDLINWIDYRDGSGIALDVFGVDNIKKLIEYRKNHDFKRRKVLWDKLFEVDAEKTIGKIEDAVQRQYEEVFSILSKHEVWIIPGNVDSDSAMRSIAGNNVNFVDSTVVNYREYKIGFAGGGVPTPLRARGELSEDEFNTKLLKLEGVDIICTHAPPLVDELVTDVITNKKEQGWSSLVGFIYKNKPLFSFFGDVHQPKAVRWRLGETDCINVGYNRATKKYHLFEDLVYG